MGEDTLERACRFLGSVRGTDKALMFVQYSSKILIHLLRSRNSKSQLAVRIANLAGPVSDFRILLRYYGLVPLIHWIILSEKSPSPSKTIQTLTRLQNVVNAAYYPLEHVYWLALHEVVSVSPQMRDKLGMWSCRFWAAYVVLYFYQLVEEKRLLDVRWINLERRAAVAASKPSQTQTKIPSQIKSGSSAASTSHDEVAQITAERAALRQEYSALAINTVINAAYFPLTIHWSLEKSSFPDIGVGICGTIAAVAQIYTAWKAT